MGQPVARARLQQPARSAVRGGDHAATGGLGPDRARGGGALVRRQRGIALITAILLVALATILAATIGYENAMTARRGTATFAFDQSLEVAKAAEAIAAYALRATRQQNHTTTYPAQLWSHPYGPVDLVPGVTL